MHQNLKIKTPRLGRNRLGVFFVRFPSSVDASGRRSVVQQSLKTKDPATAKLLALRFCLDLATGGNSLTAFDPLRGISPWTVNPNGEIKAEGPDDHQRLMEFLAQHKDMIVAMAQARAVSAEVAPPPAHAARSMDALVAPVTILSGTSLQEALGLHLLAEAASVSEETLNDKRGLFREFMDVFGANTDMALITGEQVARRWTPVEYKRPNQKAVGKTLGLNTLDKRRLFLNKFFNWAKQSSFYPHESPMGAKVAKNAVIKGKVRPWQEFNSDVLAKLFAPAYAGCMDKPDWYWIPLMGLFSGARIGELCDLTLMDFMEVEGIKVFEVTESKTPGSRRIVPIHSTLLDLGLWDYVESLRARKARHFVHHRPGKLSKSVSLHFCVWLKQCGLKNDRRVFHSFRSTAITEMHNSEAGAAAIRRAVGHATAGTSGVHGDYIRGILLAKLKAAIETLSFPTVDFSKLKLADPTFRNFHDGEELRRSTPRYHAQEARRRRQSDAAKALRDAKPLAG